MSNRTYKIKFKVVKTIKIRAIEPALVALEMNGLDVDVCFQVGPCFWDEMCER